MNKQENDKLSVKEVIAGLRVWTRYLLSRWVIITLIGIAGGGLGFIYAFLQKPVYKARTTFVLEEENKSGLGALGGLASLAGLDLASLGGSSGLFQGDNIIELYKSRSMIQKTLLSPAVFKGKKQLLIERFSEFYQIDKRWRDISPEDLNFKRLPFTWKQDSIITEIADKVNEKYLTVGKPDKKLTIISVQYTSEDQLFAKAFTDAIVKNVNDFYTATKTKKSAQNIAILQKQADSVKAVLNRSISGVASANEANPNLNPALIHLKTPSQKKQVDVQASSAIYGEIVKNLELSKITLRKETPLIQVIDEPVLPLKKDKPSKLLFFIFSGLLAGTGACLALIWKRMYFE